jgi:hypothetical protein
MFRRHLWNGSAMQSESAAKHHRYAKHTPFDEIYTNKETNANSGGTAITPSITRGLPKAIHIRSPWSRSSGLQLKFFDGLLS